MYVVALTRWSAAPREPEVLALAPLVGGTLYDARLLLAGALPLLLVRTDDVARAQQALALLRARGHGAVACDVDRVEASEQMFCPREFAFEGDFREPVGLRVAEPGRGERLLTFDRVLAFVRATHDAASESTTVTKTTKLSLAKAAITGGAAFTKTTVKKERHVSEDREQVLYVFDGSGHGHVILRETRLKYAGLGDRIAPSVAENFQRLVQALRDRAPQALFDEQLVGARRRAVVTAAGQGALAASNADETDLAAHLIAVAHRSGQL